MASAGLITSDHINYLIYRYLLESGFQHTSFTFTQESGVMRSSVATAKIPPGSLIAHLQRALNYVQAEVNLTDDGRPAEPEDLETIEALNLIESVQPEVCEERRQQLRARLRETQKLDADGRPAAVATKVHAFVAPEDVLVLKGHDNVVFTCAWNPKFNLLASGSNDATARVWDMSSDTPSLSPLVLRHVPKADDQKGVTSLQWSHDGEFLATGSYDGAARLWSRTGDLKQRLAGHMGPLFALRWSPSGKYLLTSSVDQTAIVWDLASSSARQTFAFHRGPCVDVSWRTDTCFASCSTDKTVIVCEVGKEEPVLTFDGHEDEVNFIRWDPTGHYLASCSDDCTAKIWTMDRSSCLHTFRHEDKVYSLTWNRAIDANLPLMLASASFDNTTRVWDVKRGTCLYTLAGHTMPVYSVDFSHDGRYLASGSYDHSLLIWSIENGSLVRAYRGGAGIFEVCWNPSDSFIAACFADNTLAVVKFHGA